MATKKHEDTSVSLHGLTIEEALKKAMDAGPYPKRPKKTRLRVLPDVPVQPPVDLTKQSSEPLAVVYLPACCARYANSCTYWFR